VRGGTESCSGYQSHFPVEKEQLMDRRAFRVDPRLLDFAKELRAKQAPAEQILWECLRSRRLNGFKFRRQTPIGEFISDFYCAECRLIIEADGKTHYGKLAQDEKRTLRLNEQGYEVVRYSNIDVYEDLDTLLSDLVDRCEQRRQL
jgi:very-short-patch-repair endonuclease